MSTLPLLRACLERLLEEHKGLLDLAERKKQALITGAMKELQQEVAQEAHNLKKIAVYEAERQQLMREFQILQGIKGRDLSLKECIAYIQDDSQRQVLSQLRDNLKVVLLQLQRMNELNQQLLEHSLSFVKETLDLFTEDYGKKLTYANPFVQSTKTSAQAFFDSKI